ncbi:protein sprint-like [Pollicipes pollicipes]|uniref:protein sprint-like n=1 Tax=Pollicipes pollicipes TaxID=41117 RepID=UPI001884E46B|nr:protein sprint-like [Pollicipes pollicipes]
MLIGGQGVGRQVRSASNTRASPVTTPASCDDDVLLTGAPRASRRRGRKKRSTHYQEADILELPASYCRSSVADKISDYEDIWASPPRELQPESTFKPRTAARSMNDLSDAARGAAEPPAAASDRTALRLELEARNTALRLSESTEEQSEAAAPPAFSKEEESRIVQAYVRQSLTQMAAPAATAPEPSDSHASDYDNVRSTSRPPTTAFFTDSESFVHVCQEAAMTDDDTAASEGTAARLYPQRLPLPRAPQESLYSPPRLNSLRLHRRSQQSGGAIKQYVLQLAADSANTFSLNVLKFLQCTREATETDPHVVMRNTRQFVNGMKNYLVKNGEGDFHQIVNQERDKLSSTEFLNLDVILEGVLEELLVRPLYDHISQLAAEDARRSGAVQRLAENLEFARGRSASSLGLKSERPPPSAAALEMIRRSAVEMQAAISPLDKLEHLLAVISALFAAAGAKDASLPADEFLPLLIFTLAHCHATTIEFEADYMWGLLHPMLLNGEAGYYLTMLSSAVHVLKNLQHYLEDRSRESTRSLSHCSGSCSGADSVDGLLRVIIPDEQQGTIISRTLPARPNTSARDICKMLGNKLRITSPIDYGLFKLINGNETLLGDQECPQLLKQELTASGTHCMLAYKRLEAKIAWPTAQL